VKAAHNARCPVCRGNIAKGDEVAVEGGFWRHVRCPFPAPGQVVPKVTADVRTHILYAVLSGDLTRARELVGTLGPADRRAYLADLTRVINMLWGADL
jgi:hypothetical protein